MKNIISFFILVNCILCVSGNAAHAAAETGSTKDRSVNGVIVDEAGEPVAGVSVLLKGTTIGTGSNAKGEFTLKWSKSTSAQDVLFVSSIGFEPEEIAISGSSKGQLKITLKESSENLNELVFTGTRTAKPLKDVPVLTRVISEKAISQINPMNIETLLQYQIPGLQIVYNSMSGLPQIKYQGMGGQYVLFLIDGEPVSGEGADGNVDFSRFNIDEIERVEVVKGAQSTMYGSNALGGVINIITKKADRPFTGNINARYGNTTGSKFTVSGGTRQSNFSSYTSLTYRMNDTYTIGNDTSSTLIRGYGIWDASQSFSYAFNEKVEASIKGTYYHNKRDILENDKTGDIFSDLTLTGRIKYIINEKNKLDASYNFDDYRKDRDFIKLGEIRKNMSNIKHTARLNYTGFYGRHTVTAGVEGNYEYMQHYMFQDSSSHTVYTLSAYLQEDWKITPKIDVIAGLRADYHEKYGFHATPKISAMYKPWEMLAIRGGYSQGFRSPSMKELYMAYDMGGLGIFMIYGNENLKPETSHQFSLSAEFNRWGFNASVSGYYNLFNNKISRVAKNDGTSDLQYVNAENARSTGIEIITGWTSDFGLAAQVSYSFVDDYQESDGYNISDMRPHSMTFNISYSHDFGKKISGFASLNGYWGSALKTYTFNEDTGYSPIYYDPRTICSLSFGAYFPYGIKLDLGIDNLFNYKDKTSAASIQLPQRGIGFILSLNINIADMFGI